MLRVNAACRSEAELKKAVIAQCSRFGSVSSAKVIAPPDHDYTVALVQMSRPEETTKLLQSLGDAKVGRSVLIWIE